MNQKTFCFFFTNNKKKRASEWPEPTILFICQLFGILKVQIFNRKLFLNYHRTTDVEKCNNLYIHKFKIKLFRMRKLKDVPHFKLEKKDKCMMRAKRDKCLLSLTEKKIIY